MPTANHKASHAVPAYQVGEEVRYSNENFAGSGTIASIKTTKDGLRHYIIDVGKGVEVDFTQSQLQKNRQQGGAPNGP